MAYNPLNLLLAFLLELAGIASMAYWGWTQHDGVMRVLLAIGVPTLAATIWGVFRVPGEPGDAPVPVRGFVRLLIEWMFYITAVGLLAAAGQTQVAMIFGGLVLLHYITGYDRIWKFLT
jgi:hypothetical protein